jgi:hypothetical protein
MAERVNLCKVSPDLRDRIDDVKSDESWPDFMEKVADVFENGVIVKTERIGGRVSQTRLEPGETHQTVGETLSVSVAFAENEYECERCGDDYPLTEVIVSDGGERVVCGGCLDVEDRIIE